MANLNTVNLAAAVKESYEKRLLTRAIPRMVHGKFVLRARINKFGALEWRKYAALSNVTTALIEATTPVEQSAPTLSEVTATPSFYGM